MYLCFNRFTAQSYVVQHVHTIASDTRLLSCVYFQPYTQLKILGYLDSKDLCSICLVCSQWANIATDNLLWQKRLKYDEAKWNTISHSTNPDSIIKSHSDLHFKEM